jgi:DeoR/GlpR family transcriptional regulator of sugar metabolism
LDVITNWSIGVSKKVKQRHWEIIRILETEDIVYVAELADLFKVTKETIRADLDTIEKEHGYERIHGGLKRREQQAISSKYHYQQQLAEHIDEKKRIAFRALDLILDGDCIYLDSGSTVACLLHYLSRRNNLTVVTPSIALLMKYVVEGYDEMFKTCGHRFIFAGGSVDTDIHTTYGAVFNQTVETFYFNTVFASCDGIDLTFGGSNNDDVSHQVISSVLKQSHRVILMGDQSKFDKIRPYLTFKWEQIDYLVTNAVLNDEQEMVLKRKNVIYYKA